jgi:uncharacterized protein
MIWPFLSGIGIVAGIASGLFGIGGGLIIVPALLWLLKFPMHTASATSLAALLLPISACISVYEYYSAGKIDLQHIGYGAMICAGMAVGAYIGSHLALSWDANTLRKGFAVFMGLTAIMTWFKGP